MTDAELVVQREEIVLLPERAVFRPRVATLYVADAHIGKAAAFRAERLAVPVGTTGGTLERLDRAIARTGAMRLVVLGDFIHARGGRHPHTMEQLAAWRSRHADLSIELIRGNHDVAAGDPDLGLDVRCYDPPADDHGFVLLHRPGDRTGPFWLAGHVHPAVTLVGAARQSAFLPCFHVTPWGVVLPSVGDFTGRAEIFPARGDRVFVIADEDVMEVRPAGPASA